MSRFRWLFVTVLALFTLLPFHPNVLGDDIGIRAPEGFEVTEFAGDDIAHDIFSMTIDSQGRVVVAGAGYIKILTDRDGDGRADQTTLFSDLPKNGAQGMHFVGRSLLCVGDAGLLRFRDADGDDRADGPPDVFLRTKTGGEHDVHSIQQGPDGWWYVIAGNGAGITGKYATLASSPIKQPRAGVIFRLKPDLSGGEIVTEGLRNAYDFTFSPQGDLFTYDSDEEREVSLPWYRPIRVSHCLTGFDHGWVSKSWMRPDGYCDMPPTIASFGRGSPTGVTCYRHKQFPAKYHGAVFTLDWTYGRVHALPLSPSGETWATQPELFLSASGQHGFAPTDVEVGPDGSLFVSVGGRGTRGGIYRIRHVEGATSLGNDTAGASKTLDEQLTAVLEAPQPLSSWSRANWLPVAKELGPEPFKKALLDETQSVARRVRAIEVLTDLFRGVDEDVLTTLTLDPSPEVRARAIWSYGRSQTTHAADAKRSAEQLKAYLSDTHPLVARSALEMCLGLRESDLDWPAVLPAIGLQLGNAHRFNRALAAKVVTQLDAQHTKAMSAEAARNGVRGAVSYAFGSVARPQDEAARIRGVIPALATSVLMKKENGIDLKLDAIRLLQVALGDLGPGPDRPPVFDGYTSKIDLEPYERDLDGVRAQLGGLYPTGHERLDVELVRLLAQLNVFNSRVVDGIVAKLTEDSDPLDDIHLLVALARMPMTHTVKQRDAIVTALVQLESKVIARKLPQDASWSDRVKEMWVKLALADEFLAPSLVNHPQFGRPGHTIFLNQMPPELLPIARAAFAKQIAADTDYAWSTEIIFALGESEEVAHRDLVRAQFDRFAVRGAVLVLLSKKPDSADRAKFVTGLDWSQTEVQTACLSALEGLEPSSDVEEQLMLLKSLRRLGQDEREYAAREQVVRLLERNTGQKFPFVTGKDGHRPQPETVLRWTTWFQKKWPTETAVTLGENDAEVTRMKQLLADADWATGDPGRGAELFTKRACIQCHSGRGALGPDLSGAANRFSKEDLFAAIVLPSRDVSARYQTTLVTTKDGKSYSGLIVYESVDGFLLRSGTGQTYRIETHQVDEKRKSPVSLMPTGLLKDATSRDLSDLHAYLRTLTANKTASNTTGRTND